MFTRILVDADSLLYRCGFAAQGEDVSHACQNLKSQISKIKEALGCDTMSIYIKGKGNFRDDVAISRVYKGTRTGELPTAYPDLRKYIIEVHGATEVDGMEADDACSIELYKDHSPDSTTVLAAMDKDLWNTPGWHFNYDPRKWSCEYVTPEEANRNFLWQLLRGDRSDNVQGLPYFTDSIAEYYGVRCGKVGPRAADQLLEGVRNSEAFIRVLHAYISYGKKAFKDDADAYWYALEQGRLLWMTRHVDEEGKPVLWDINADAWAAALLRDKTIPGETT